MRFLSVVRRVDVTSAGQHKCVDAIEDLVGVLDQRGIGRQHQRQRVRPLNRLDVGELQQRAGSVPESVLRPLECRRDSDDWATITHVSEGIG